MDGHELLSPLPLKTLLNKKKKWGEMFKVSIPMDNKKGDISMRMSTRMSGYNVGSPLNTNTLSKNCNMFILRIWRIISEGMLEYC